YGQRAFYSDQMPVDGLAPVLHTNFNRPSALPATVAKLERHPHAAQAFIPLDVERYIVTVCPSLADGSPDLEKVLSFAVPGTEGVIYARGVWHAGASVLDRDGSFAVLMWRGRPDDDEFQDIPPLTLAGKDA
ncbi:MAG: ureidoglycolate lyase, partial [Devosia sp.]